MFANFNFVNNNYNKNNFINNNNNNNNNFNNYSNLRYNNSQANIEISYDNYFTNNYYKEIEKEKYANDLRQQIEENKLRKEIEKRKKEEEDLKDELRLIKENQQLELQQKKENKKIISNNNNNINNNIKIIKNNNNNNYFQSYLQQRSNEIKTKDNEIKNLLSSINDTFFHQINRMNFELEKLKEVNLHSNLYKIDLAKSIQDLSNTLHKKNYEQSFKKDSIYKMMIETNKRKLNLQNHLKFNKIPYYDNNNYINLSRSISYNVPRTKPLKELGWYY